jgi:chromosome segregation ATPase
MSTKRGKLTAGKARERVASLEESITARQHRLDQLEARLDRSESPDERLLTAKTRLERRLDLEKEQLEKLLKLLGRDTVQPEESGEYFASEEIDDLHRSFEEVRQNLAQMQSRIDSSEMPRDLTARLSSFEERVARREEVDSELFSQVLSLQTALDQERQTVRRLSRRTREQDQSLDALREAVEDSVVATVDLAERLEELEEAMSENAESKNATSSKPAEPQTWNGEIEMLRELVEDARRGLLGLQKQVVESLAHAAQEREELRLAQADFAQKQTQAEAVAAQLEASGAASVAAQEVTAGDAAVESEAVSTISSELLVNLLSRLEALEKTSAAAVTVELPVGGPKPAVFAKNGSPHRQVALFGVRPASPGGQPLASLSTADTGQDPKGPVSLEIRG